MRDVTWVCEKCGSTDIQQVMWVYVNTDKVVDMYGDGDVQDMWCDKCQDHTDQITEEEYNNANQ